MIRTLEVPTSMYDPDPNKYWSFGCDGYVIDVSIGYPDELDNLSDLELEELADEGEDVHYIS